MIFKEWLRFIYGMAMGTSVPYIKPTNRFMWPTALRKIDDNLSLFLGGSCVCGILHDSQGSLLINTNSGAAGAQLHQFMTDEIKSPAPIIINTSAINDVLGGSKFFLNSTRILIPDVSDKNLLREWPDRPETLEKITEEKTIELAGETCVIVPVRDSASHCDLAVFLKKRKILFLGSLFYNRIHPVLRSLEGMNVNHWIGNLEALMERFQPNQVIPAEGDVGDTKSLLEFISYLKSLSDPKVEFSDCRKNYDWLEIPGQTSLEENFDLLRENIKSFTKF